MVKSILPSIAKNISNVMRRKKDLPLAVLKSLSPFVGIQGEKFEIIDPKEYLLFAKDKDADSDFHFVIEKYKRMSNGAFQYLITKSPKNIYENQTTQHWVNSSDLNRTFNAWIEILAEYDITKSFFDDPILNAYQEEFFAEFEFIEEDADIKPFSTKQILQIDSYLDLIEEKLEEFTTESNKPYILDIKTDISILKENLTIKSKKWIVRGIAKMWGKIAKQGTKFIKEFLSEAKKEIVKQGVKGIINFVKDNGMDLLT